MFRPGNAHFSGFVKDKESYVDFVRHKAYIDIHEKGTGAVFSPERPPNSHSYVTRTPFVVNKPFVYFIRHNVSGAILFAGIIRSP